MAFVEVSRALVEKHRAAGRDRAIRRYRGK
jgi:hypothetical protein